MAEGQKRNVPDYLAKLKAVNNEPIASFLGMKLIELTPGYSKVTMKLRPEYQNFNGVTFGGIIMAMADQAFAYASNSVSHPAVAVEFQMHFLSSPNPDDELTAEGRVLKNGRRAGISEMTVTNQNGKLIAKATGTTIPLQEREQ